MNIIHLIKKIKQRKRLITYLDNMIYLYVVTYNFKKAATYSKKLERVRRVNVWATKKKR